MTAEELFFGEAGTGPAGDLVATPPRSPRRWSARSAWPARCLASRRSRPGRSAQGIVAKVLGNDDGAPRGRAAPRAGEGRRAHAARRATATSWSRCATRCSSATSWSATRSSTCCARPQAEHERSTPTATRSPEPCRGASSADGIADAIVRRRRRRRAWSSSAATVDRGRCSRCRRRRARAGARSATGAVGSVDDVATDPAGARRDGRRALRPADAIPDGLSDVTGNLAPSSDAARVGTRDWPRWTRRSGVGRGRGAPARRLAPHVAPRCRTRRRWVVGVLAAGSSGPRRSSPCPLLGVAAIDDGMRQGDGGTVLALDDRDPRGRRRSRRSCTGLRRYAAFRHRAPDRDRPPPAALRAPPAPALRVPRPVADRPAHGAARTPTSSRSDNVVILIPLTIASTLTMIAVLAIMLINRSPVLAFFALGALPLLNIAGDPLQQPDVPGRASRCSRSSPTSRASSRRAVAGVRVVKGFGAERMQIEAARGRGRRACSTGRSAAANLRAGFLPLIDFLPTLALVGDPLVRRAPGARRATSGRRHRRLQPLRPHAHLAAAHGRHAPRAGVRARRRPAGRIHEILVDRPRDRRPARRAARCPTGPGERALRGRARSATAPAGRCSNGLDLVDPRRRGGRARRRDRHRARPPSRACAALLRRRRRARAARRRRRARPAASRDLRQRGRHRVRGHVPVLRHGAREHRVRRSRGADGTRCARAARLAGRRRRSSTSCPTATTR